MLCIINFQTLIATKSARIALAAQGEPVLEFGLRRAQGIDGSLSATRAAYIGGCSATSSLLAGKLFGIPVRGTHAHSWVMCFDDELEAFRRYAAAMPNNCVFLVDTYDTHQGVRNAITVARELRAAGHEIVGIRLDSGDLAWLSLEARRMLDEAGFPEAQILATNDLDEHIITSLKHQGAKIVVWGVGTKLATAYDEPALGGVYKLAAIREESGKWKYRIKLSEQALKISTPGILQVRRYFDGNDAIGDMIFDQELSVDEKPKLVDQQDPTRVSTLPARARHEDLLTPVLRGGKLIGDLPPLAAIRQRTQQQLAHFSGRFKRLTNPHRYLHRHRSLGSTGGASNSSAMRGRPTAATRNTRKAKRHALHLRISSRRPDGRRRSVWARRSGSQSLADRTRPGAFRRTLGLARRICSC